MGRRLLLVAIAAAVAVPTAAAATFVERDGTRAPEPYQRWIDAAKVPTPSGVIRLDLTDDHCRLPVRIESDMPVVGRTVMMLETQSHSIVHHLARAE